MNDKKKNEQGALIELSYIVSLQEASHRRSTRSVNHALLRHLSAFMGRPPRLSDITEAFCQDFASFLASRVAAGSARTYLHKLHAFLEHAVGQHLLPCNPMPAIRKLLPQPRPSTRVHLSREDVALLSSTRCRHPETKRAFLFACQTGLRLSDIETLTWGDIVDVCGVPTIVKMQVKTHRVVRIPLNTIALQLLGSGHDGERVFRLMSRSVISADLRQWAADAGIGKRLTFHVSRHTFATMAITAGVDIYVVSKLCGHTTVKTTEIYAHMVDFALQQGVTLISHAMHDKRQYHRKWISKMFSHLNGGLEWVLRRKRHIRSYFTKE